MVGGFKVTALEIDHELHQGTGWSQLVEEDHADITRLIDFPYFRRRFSSHDMGAVLTAYTLICHASTDRWRAHHI